MTGNAYPVPATKSDGAFLLRYFEDFYCEVVRFRQAIDSYMSTSTLQDESRAPMPAFILPDNIQESLLKLLNSQAIDTARFAGDYGTQEYREAEFVMVALADETFVQLDWPGKAMWRENLLEARLYQSHKAGDTLFQHIDKFIRMRDPSRVDLGMIYLLALGLGFQGRYRGSDDHGTLARYKTTLFHFLYKREPATLDGETLLCKEAYANTIEEGKAAYFNEFRPWALLFTAACGLLLLISYGIWRFETRLLYRHAHEIIQMSINAP